MTLRIFESGYGQDSVELLCSLVTELKSQNAFRPIKVVCSSAQVGLFLRKTLRYTSRKNETEHASLNSYPRPPRIEYLTVDDWIESIYMNISEGRNLLEPVPKILAPEFIKAAIKCDDKSPYQVLLNHNESINRLSSSVEEIRQNVDLKEFEQLTLSPKAASIRNLFFKVNGILERNNWTDKSQKTKIVVNYLSEVSSTKPKRLLLNGEVVILYLLRDLSNLQETFINVVCSQCSLSNTVIGVNAISGIKRADTINKKLLPQCLKSINAEVRDKNFTSEVHVCSFSTMDAEILWMIRQASSLLIKGSSPSSIGILYGNDDNYARAIREQLNLASIPYYQPGIDTYLETHVGKMLKAIYFSIKKDMDLRMFSRVIQGLPLTVEGEPLDTFYFDEFLKSNRIIMLKDYEDYKSQPTNRSDANSRSGHKSHHSDLKQIDSLVNILKDTLKYNARNLKDWIVRARDICVGNYDIRLDQSKLSEEDSQSIVNISQQLDIVLNSLAEHSMFENYSVDSFTKFLENLLSQKVNTTKIVGEGIFVGEVSQAIGLEFDTLFICGLNAKNYPPKHEDSVLSDNLRKEISPSLLLRNDRIEGSFRDVVAAILSGREVFLSYSNGDQLEGRVQRPTRWLMEIVKEFKESRFRDGKDSNRVIIGNEIEFDSYQNVVCKAKGNVSLDDFDLSILSRHFSDGGIVQGLKLENKCIIPKVDEVLIPSWKMVKSMEGDEFTPYDGNIGETRLGYDLKISPSALSTYSKCPREYFYSYVLSVEGKEDMRDVVKMSDGDFGLFVHSILEDAVKTLISSSNVEKDKEKTSLEIILRSSFQRMKEAAPNKYATGKKLMWEQTLKNVERVIFNFIEIDKLLRSDTTYGPSSSEYKTLGAEINFGPNKPIKAQVHLDKKLSVNLIGMIDRLDQDEDGNVRVIDYKTGNKPVKIQERIQIQLLSYHYATLGIANGKTIETILCYVGEDPEKALVRSEFKEPFLEAFKKYLGKVITAMNEGRFPFISGPRSNGRFDNCSYCSFKEICPSNRDDLGVLKNLESRVVHIDIEDVV